jgi:hypothetical protein
VAGVRTSRLDSTLDVSENWWGTTNASLIRHSIFDFDDWNDHAQAIFRPFLIEDSFEGSVSVIITFIYKIGVIIIFFFFVKFLILFEIFL